MAAIPITLIGTSTTDPSGQTTFVGVAVVTGLGIGGGPIVPQPPLGIWGPTDPRPGNPISGIPGLPGGPGQQPGIWGPTDGMSVRAAFATTMPTVQAVGILLLLSACSTGSTPRSICYAMVVNATLYCIPK
jgi:hypothetical protein